MPQHTKLTVYELSLNVRLHLEAHSMSNIGSAGNRLLPRRQLLADGTEVDAISGNIQKHHHADILANYMNAMGILLCPACAKRDGRRAAALVDKTGRISLNIDEILTCGMCDAHGFLVPSKNKPEIVRTEETDIDGEDQPKKKKSTKVIKTKVRDRLSKHSLIEFSYGLALPENFTDTPQLLTRTGDEKGDGQMLVHQITRSGFYGQCVRYTAAGIGVDTNTRRLVIADEAERLRRHQAILSALRDDFLSPSGALTSSTLPHLAGLAGVVMIQTQIGRAPTYSPLAKDFIERLAAMKNEQRVTKPFHTVDEFSAIMDDLIANSLPAGHGQLLLSQENTA